MTDETNVYGTVLTYFSNEFTTIKERLKTGQFENYRERVVVSQLISEAINLLAPYVRSDARTRILVRNGETLKKDLLSVRDLITRKSSPRPENPSLLKALLDKKQ
ncbi:hypothetical protein [Geotalea toluenoxydans]|uniref:hypothetical protein n=1 Tax=Geotalea toluenoxydans TaxID=421624 RepID=UPI0006D1C3E3|nr:hypothetical protein [Geotalea toluenoxydans]